MHALIQRFWTPKMVEKYYDQTILLSPLFLLLTVVYALTTWEAAYRIHGGRDFATVLILITSVWVHIVVQHAWFKSDDVQRLKTNASRTTLAFGTLFIITVGVLLSMVK